jgi:hypothetical protein
MWRLLSTAGRWRLAILLRVAFVRDSGLNTVTDGLRHE